MMDMIIVMRQGVNEMEIQQVEKRLQELGFATHIIVGEEKTVIGAIGDKSALNSEGILNMPGVENVMPIMKPYKLVSRELKKKSSVITVRNVKIGGENLVVMAGPCAVESEEQLFEAAEAVKKAGATILRGGAFKPRTSPYAFQGLEEDGLKLLAKASQATGMPIVTEAVDPRDVELVARYADIIQVGARNMQNFRLLREVGQTGKPVLLKRGMSATIEDWLMAAEYIMAAGSHDVILCERGIRTYETAVRNTLDLSAIPVVKELSHLPIIIDPSHATGYARYVAPMAKGAVAAGADGLMIEVHPNPSRALCDGPQSLTPAQFTTLMQELCVLSRAVGRRISACSYHSECKDRAI
jgi:3-deoxy-7-phosphoheptulonate synthase